MEIFTNAVQQTNGTWLKHSPVQVVLAKLQHLLQTINLYVQHKLVRNHNNTLAVRTLVTLPMMFLSGIFFDISGMKALVIISKFSPLTYIVEALRSSMINRNFSYAWLNIGIAFAIGITAFVIGVFLTQWNQDKKQ